jgi:Phosphatidylethanolamine-binding protein
MRPDDRVALTGDDAILVSRRPPAATPHLGTDRGDGTWARRFDHPFSGGGVRASEQRLRARRADPAPAQLRGGGSLASTRLVGRAGGHPLARAGGRRPRRPRGHLHSLARLGPRPWCHGARRGRGRTGRGPQRLRHERLPGALPATRGHGRHRYSFRLYALNSDPALPSGAGKRELERALEGHTLAAAELIGTTSVRSRPV